MERFTEEYILYLIDKNREEIIADLENCMCLDCYNMVKGLSLNKNNVEFQDSVCSLCKKTKSCIKVI